MTETSVGPSRRYEDWQASVYQGDCRDVLAGLPDGSVNCVVTSPPYWGLRDYGTASWSGGDPECEHKKDIGARASSGLNGSLAHKSGEIFTPYQKVCGKCHAIRVDSQLGLEPTPDEYVENLVAVFREVRRVLRGDGTVWLNLGDSYASQGGPEPAQTKWQVEGASKTQNAGRSRQSGALKPKDLVGIPWRVAFALQADGWWLRSDIIWSKPNPMPESVQDRPTRAHEYVFLLSKSARYWYDAAAIREPRKNPGAVEKMPDGWDTGPGSHGAFHRNGREKGATDKQRGHGRRHAGFNDRWDGMTREEQQAMGANKRSVWEIATQPFPGAHFATFPEALVKPCILAGCPEGGTVLDPFAGSGTVGVVARKAGRKSVLIELSEDYCELIVQRLGPVPMELVSVREGRTPDKEMSASTRINNFRQFDTED